MEHDGEWHHWRGRGKNAEGAVYGCGLIGALVYYIQNAHGFGAFLFGVVKAIVWPAILVYHALSFLHL